MFLPFKPMYHVHSKLKLNFLQIQIKLSNRSLELLTSSLLSSSPNSNNFNFNSSNSNSSTRHKLRAQCPTNKILAWVTHKTLAWPTLRVEWPTHLQDLPTRLAIWRIRLAIWRIRLPVWGTPPMPVQVILSEEILHLTLAWQRASLCSTNRLLRRSLIRPSLPTTQIINQNRCSTIGTI